MVKKTNKSKTKSVEFTLKELEHAYIACSNYTSKSSSENFKPRIQVRVVNKIREVLLNAVLNR